MTMKSKPKDLDAFLSGPAEQGAATGQSAARQPSRITKTIRISTETEAALKDAAYNRSKDVGRRVTESDLIDEAIKKYLNI